MEVHHFFFLKLPLTLRAQNLSRKLIWRKTKLLPYKKSYGLGIVYNDNHANINGLFPTILG